MKRQYLESGHELLLGNSIFKVKNLIGTGANCAVYEVERRDGEYSYKYYLKECYPFNAEIIRNEDGTVEWLNEEEKNWHLSKFRKAYATLLEIYNSDSFRNSTSMPIEQYEANGTLYFLNDIKTGKTFENDSSGNLSDILATVIALAKLIEKYHQAGYLHLDIKPENIFLLEETRDIVVLFDVDSIAPVELINNGQIKHISFSENYAAPELIRGRLKDIGEQTDIYSIGATLFLKVMGRYVSASDRDFYAEWCFDEISMFENINPQTKKYIKEVFRKTLAVRKDDRYKKVPELIEALEKAKAECDKKTYLTSDYPSVIKNFAGRKEELRKIRLAFEEKYNVVFLSGFGGIGKSELAKKYANSFADDYDAILFCTYTGSLKNTLSLIPVGEEYDQKSGFYEKEVVLKKILNKRVLLIIDNFDVDVAKDEYLCELSKYNTNIIITTRTDFSDFCPENYIQIDISTIDTDSLKTLFVNESGVDGVSVEEEGFIDEILSAYKYHTLFVKPLAYKIKHMGYTIEELKNEVVSELLEDNDLVTGVYDNKPFEETLRSLAEKLYKIDQLESAEKQILSDLYMLGRVKISIKGYIDDVYKESSHVDKKQIRNKIISLIRVGLIQRDELTDDLEIHPVIAELINKNIKPNISKCQQISLFLHNKVVCLVNEVDSYVYGDEADVSLENLCDICRKTDLETEENRDYIINLMFDACKNRRYDWIMHLYGDVFEQMSDNSDNIKLQYLKFLSFIYTEDFFAELDGIPQPRTDLEEFAVDYIYNFYKEKNDGSELFSNIFWKMILTYVYLLESLEYWGWNISSYEKLNECMVNAQTSGNTLHNYVFLGGDEDFGSVYMTEEGEWIDENQIVRTPQLIREIYQENHSTAGGYNIDTENKYSFEIYNECVSVVLGDCRRKLDKYTGKCKQDLSPSDLEEISTILDEIRTNPLLYDFKEELQESYTELFVLVDADMKYKTIIEEGKENLRTVFGKILADEELSEMKRYEYLYMCINSIIRTCDYDMGYETQAKVIECISDYTEQLIAYSIERSDTNGILDSMLFAYFITDYNKFEKITKAVIKGSIDKKCEEIRQGKYTVFSLIFREFISRMRLVGKCHLFYPFLCEYVDALCDLDKCEEAIVYNLEYAVKDCMNCAKFAYAETKDKEYRQAYREYKKKLKLIEDMNKQ